MNLDAKKRFNAGEHSKLWHDLVTSAAFGSASEAALVTMLAGLPKPSDLATAAANDWRMQGARMFLEQLMNLTEIALDKKPAPANRINYKV
jgi:hypothetical protein